MSTSMVDRRRFELLHCLGAGGFGEVYLANMVSAGGVRSEVALKILHNGLDPRGQAVERLRDEARLLGLFNHPSILRIHDLVLLEGRVTLVTEFVDGADLDSCVEGPDALPLAATLAVIGKIADALNTAYNRQGPDGAPLKLLHRDIKPANIRIGRHGQVKLLDFGIATATGFNREAQTQANALIGSFPYMAPERFERRGDTTASDVYSLGCVLYEAVSGERLYDEMEVREFFSNAVSAEKHDIKRDERLGQVANLHPGVFQLLRELLHHDASHRPPVQSLGLRCEDLADEVGGMNLSRWCRRHDWPVNGYEQGALSGRVITESSLTTAYSSLVPLAKRNTLRNGPVNSDVPAPQRKAAPTQAEFSTPIVPVPVSREVPDKLPIRGWVAAAMVAVCMAAIGGGVVFLGTLAMVSGEPEAAMLSVPVQEMAVDVSLDELPTSAVLASNVDKAEDRPDEPVSAAIAVSESTDCAVTNRLESAARRGALSASQAPCLRRQMRDAKRKLTDRGKSGRVLLAHLQQRCTQGQDCAQFEAEQRYFFEQIDRSDVDLMYGWALYLSERVNPSDGQRGETLTWVDRTLERKSSWRGVDYVKRVDRMLEVAAKVAYARFSADDHNERLRKASRNRSVAWLNNRVQLGRDTAEALALCASATGTEDDCRARMYESQAQITVTLASVPPGATVVVDGVTVGEAPVAVSLAPGKHKVQMRGTDGVSKKTVVVEARGATLWTWRSSSDRWQSNRQD